MTLRPNCLRPQLAVVIAVCLLTSAAGFVVLPDLIFLLATGAVAVGGASLLATYYVPAPTSDRLRPSVTVPVWFVTGVVVLTVVLIAFLEAGSPSIADTVFTALIIVFGAHLLSVLARHFGWWPLDSSVDIPIGLVGASAILGATFGLGRYLLALTPYELLLLAALLVMMLYIGFIVPVGLVALSQGTTAAEPSAPYPEISVLIPAYNEADWIEPCLESVLAATYPAEKKEIIVIDDGSEDDTYARAAAYRDEGVRVVRRPNGGRDAARNYGFFCSNGDLIITLDADSLLDPDALQTIVAAFQADPDLGAVAGDIRVLNTDHVITKIQAIEYVFSINTFRRACSFFDVVPIVPGCLGGFRREAMEGIYGFDPDTITEDFDATLQLLDDGWHVRQVNAIAWTEAPFTLGDLWTQRIRWYSGGLQCILKHRRIYRSAEWTYLHLFIFPFLSLSYVFRPVVVGIAVLALYSVVATGLVTVGGLLYFISAIGVVTVLTLYILDADYWLFPWYVFLLIGYKQFIDLVFLRSILGIALDFDVGEGNVAREAHVTAD